QKVVGSIPFTRFTESPAVAGFLCVGSTLQYAAIASFVLPE
ncbi:hypothetical protein LCGC14_3018090, partial [marine sediment metagenome]